MEARILITGASGCGTTTLGKALALRVGAAFYDADDYYWLAKRRCPVLGIDGDTSTEYRVARVLGVLNLA